MAEEKTNSENSCEVSGRAVFFIGAGFTKAIAKSAPTGNDFLAKAFEPHWNFAKTAGDRIHELKEFFEIAYHPLEGRVPFPRVEDVLSLFDFCILNKAPLTSRYDVDS